MLFIEKIVMFFILPQVNPEDLRYVLSAIIQALASILALVFTIRLIVGQNLQYKIPLKILIKFTREEKSYVTLYILTITLSLILLTELTFYYPYWLTCLTWLATLSTIVCIVLLFPFVVSMGNFFTMENVLIRLRNYEIDNIKKLRKKGIITSFAENHLYKIAIESWQKKDYYIFRLMLENLLKVASLFSYVITRQIGSIRETVSDDNVASEHILYILYCGMSPLVENRNLYIQEDRIHKKGPEAKIDIKDFCRKNDELHPAFKEQLLEYAKESVTHNRVNRIKKVLSYYIKIIYNGIFREKVYGEESSLPIGFNKDSLFDWLKKELLPILSPDGNLIDEIIEEQDTWRRIGVLDNIIDCSKFRDEEKWREQINNINKIAIESWTELKDQWRNIKDTLQQRKS